MIPPLAQGSVEPLGGGFDVALLDLVGVLYVGPNAVPGAAFAVNEIRSRGMQAAFVTNNASRTPSTVAEHLTHLGIAATEQDVVTSAQAAATLLVDLVPPGSRVLVVGGDGLVEALGDRGFVPVWSLSEAPAAVVQGFSPKVNWEMLAEGAHAVRTGLPWVASNLDITVPTPGGPAPGNGTLVGVIAAATGRTPVAAGKPELPLHQEAVRRTASTRPLVIGDRLDTDIEGANRAAVPSLLVLTGVTTAMDLVRAEPIHRPTWVSEDLPDGLLQPHPPVQFDGANTWACRTWRASVRDDRVEVEGEGERIDALRAVCVAAWETGCLPSDQADRLITESHRQIGITA